LKKAYNDAYSSFLQENVLHVVDKWTFPALFSLAWEKAVSSTNVQNGFRACGIVPLNRRAVPTRAFCPSKLTDQPVTRPVSASANVSSEDVVSPPEPVLASQNMPVKQVVSSLKSVIHVVSENISYVPVVPPPEPVLALGNISIEDVSMPAPINESLEEVTMPFTSVSFDGDNLSSSDSSLASILDISEPGQLMSLLATGDAIVMDIIPEEEEISVNSSIDALFLPPQIEKRSESVEKRRSKPTSHKLLTSIEVLEQKRALIEKKMSKRK
jgi:hypothetical protein